MTENKVKRDVLSMLEGASIEEIKESLAELSELYIELGGSVDELIHTNKIFTKEVHDLLGTLRGAIYFCSVSNLALTDLLIESGIITREDLQAKISACPQKKKLAEYLRLDFLTFSDLEKVSEENLEGLERWLDAEMMDQIRKLH